MTVDQILSLEEPLAAFLAEFDVCFPRSEPRGHLATYVKGQLSDLPRKSIEPMADQAGVPRRTLQEFVSWSEWPAEGMRDRLQAIVARDHQDPNAIGIVDESGHVKSGPETAGVQRQYCGRLGKVDNCVVTVHLGYASFDTRFATLLDGRIYLPKHGWDEPQRRQKAEIPECVRYQAKWAIALEEIRTCLNNGVRLRWITADEGYGSKPGFRDGVAALGLHYVLEVPRNLCGWTYWPGPRPQTRPSRFDRLCRHAAAFLRSRWQRIEVKSTAKGAVVWQAKAARIWMRRGVKSAGPFWLLWVQNLLDPSEAKWFLSNAPAKTKLKTLLAVAFARWPIEQSFQFQKSELGLSHFEVRKWPSIHRHLAVTMVSQLFLVRQTQRLRGEKSGDHLSTSSPRHRRGARYPRSTAGRQAATSRAAGRFVAANPTQERRCPRLSSPNPPRPPSCPWLPPAPSLKETKDEVALSS
jgi:SRSO17 transposase